MPTKMVIEYLDIFLPVIVKLINGSLESRVVPKCFKTAVIKPLQKEPNLDPNSMNKFLGHVVTKQLAIHLNENHLLDKFQSAYCEFFIIETGNEYLAVQREWW